MRCAPQMLGFGDPLITYNGDTMLPARKMCAQTCNSSTTMPSSCPIPPVFGFECARGMSQLVGVLPQKRSRDANSVRESHLVRGVFSKRWPYVAVPETYRGAERFVSKHPKMFA
jgi:hypothetical protein